MGFNYLKYMLSDQEYFEILKYRYINDPYLKFIIKKDFPVYCAKNKLNKCFMFLYENGVNINCQDHIGDTPLIAFCKNSNYEMAELLIKDPDIDINTQNEFGESALMIVSDTEFIISALLSRKDINVNLQDSYGRTALMKFVLSKNLECVKLIYNHDNIDIELKDFDGLNVVDISSVYGELIIHQYLVN